MNHPIDFRKYANNSKPHYSEFTDISLSLPEQVSEIIRTGCLFPSHDIQYPIVANYLILPSALMEITPILFLCGKQGSGKSQIGILASKLHNSSIFSTASSFAAIRNSLTVGRVKTFNLPKEKPEDMPSQVTLETNIFLIWDDLDPSLLIEQKQLYRILKNGYNRATSQIQISSEKVGSNLAFNCFAPKLISSVSNLLLDPRFRELSRRCLFIETNPLEEINKAAKERNSNHIDYESDMLLDFGAYDWDGFNKSFHDYWNDEQRLGDYSEALRDIGDKLKGVKYSVSSNDISVCKEFLAIGLLSEIYINATDAVTLFNEFVQLRKNVPEVSRENLVIEVIDFIAKEVNQIDTFNLNFKGRLSYSIKANLLTNHIDLLVSSGSMSSKPSLVEIKDIMLSQGWVLKAYEWIKEREILS